MNVPTVKLVCWISSLGSLGGLAKYAYDWFGNLEDRQLPIEPEYVEAVLNEDLAVAPDVREIIDYDKLKVTFGKEGMSWTGEPPPPPPEPIDTNVVKANPQIPVKRVLSVIMLQVDTVDPGGSIGHVTYIKEKQEATLQVGDILMEPYDYAVVKSIRPYVMEFAFTDPERPNEVIRTAPLPADLITNALTGGALLPDGEPIPTGKAEEEERPDETEEIAHNMFRLGDGDMQRFADDYQRILTEDVTTETYMKDGKRAGVEIKTVKPGSIASRHGAMAGDVLISINGHKVTSEAEAISYVKANNDKYTAWEVKILRFGKEEIVVYHSK